MMYKVKVLEFSEVKEILREEGYESVLDHIENIDGSYHLKSHPSLITKLPSYKYALGVTLMALGNKDAAQEVCGCLWTFIGVNGQTDVTYILSRFLSRMYEKNSR